jgi:hypothetical protein
MTLTLGQYSYYHSPSAVLLVLQQQVQQLDQSRTSDQRLSKWLDPTVNVLYAFSATLGEGVGLVSFSTRTRLRFSHSYFAGILTSQGDICGSRRPAVGVYLHPLNFSHGAIVTSRYQAAKDVRASQDTLIDIFERMENLFQRLEIYTEVTPTTEMMEMIVKIMVEMLTILAIATKEINDGRTSESFMHKYVPVD